MYYTIRAYKSTCVEVGTLHAYGGVRMQWTLKIYVCSLHNIDIIHFILPCSFPLQKKFFHEFLINMSCILCLCVCAFGDWKFNLTFEGIELNLLLIEVSVSGFIFKYRHYFCIHSKLLNWCFICFFWRFFRNEKIDKRFILLGSRCELF